MKAANAWRAHARDVEDPIKVGWLLLAAVHVAPAATVVFSALADRLYGPLPGGSVGLLLQHRGVLFAVVLVTALWAAIDAQVRRLASVAVGLSVLGFLALYGADGAPEGPLGGVAIVDAVTTVPWVLVTLQAWRARTSNHEIIPAAARSDPAMSSRPR